MRIVASIMFWCTVLNLPLALAKPAKKLQKETEVHRFTGLTLKGQLKKPELSYSYKRSDLQSEQLIEIPENFNESILQDAAGVEP